MPSRSKDNGHLAARRYAVGLIRSACADGPPAPLPDWSAEFLTAFLEVAERELSLGRLADLLVQGCASHGLPAPLLSFFERIVTAAVVRNERWTGALESTDAPLAFVWGMLDPISGAHMAERIRERRPDAPLLALEDVGHWPQLEAPDRVAAALLG